LFVIGQQVFQGGGCERLALVKELDAAVQGGAEAEIPLVFGLEAVDVL
jgi:hypothetical protein